MKELAPIIHQDIESRVQKVVEDASILVCFETMFWYLLKLCQEM